MFTRKQMMNKECSYEEYMNQFVTKSGINYVSAMIGVEKIKHVNNRTPIAVMRAVIGTKIPQVIRAA